jgi:hypothetical protein
MDAASPGKNGCLKWVIKLGHSAMSAQCPDYRRKRTSACRQRGSQMSDFVVKVADEDGEDRQRELCTLPTALCRGLLRLTLP